MEKAELPPPVFENKRGVFKVTLYNERREDNTISAHTLLRIGRLKGMGDISESILSFCETPRSRDELITLTGFSRYYTMSKIVQPLIDDGKLRLTMPDKPKSPRQMYVRV
jgi:ATP-dependent DNA helicase RecG